MIAQALREIPDAVASSSIVHDNASGPGTASMAVIQHLGSEPARLEATDLEPGMIDVFQAHIARIGLKNAGANVMDSHKLEFHDGTFSTSICNISVSNFRDTSKCLQEIHRTLQPGGLAIISAWKRFAVADIIHEAQKAVVSDAQLMKIPKAEFMLDGYLRNMVIEAGFSEDMIKEQVVGIIVQGDDIDGLKEFMSGRFTAEARKEWTEEQQSKWPRAIDQAIEEEKNRHHGIKMEAWFVTARK